MVIGSRLKNAWAALRGRQYAAAKSGGSIGNWAAFSQNVNLEIGTSQRAINARVRQLVRDMPHAARIVNVLAKWIVGPGLVLQSRVKDSSGALNKTLNTAIEDAWKWWCDEADLAGRLHLYDLQSLCVRQLSEIGEFCVIKTATSAPGRYLPFALRSVEADRIADWRSVPLPGNEIYAGVEYDPRFGKTMAYWFSDDSTVGLLYGGQTLNSVRIPADRVIHGFESLRPGQLRGVSPFAPGVLLAHSLRDYLEAEIDAAKMAARWLAFITTPNPEATMGAFGAKADTKDSTRRVEEIGTAIKEYLLPGEEVKLADHNRPGDAFTPFTKFVLQTFACLMDLPYELVSGNYDGLNYSVLRGIRNDFAQSLATMRARFVRQFCSPIQRSFMGWLALTGKVELPGYFENPYPYLRSVWLGPGMAPVDPLKEGRADLDAIGGLLRSPQETILERGRDPEEVLDEIQEWNQQLQERGLEVAEPSQPSKSNPAALMDDQGDDNSGDAPRAFRRVK